MAQQNHVTDLVSCVNVHVHSSVLCNFWVILSKIFKVSKIIPNFPMWIFY